MAHIYLQVYTFYRHTNGQYYWTWLNNLLVHTNLQVYAIYWHTYSHYYWAPINVCAPVHLVCEINYPINAYD